MKIGVLSDTHDNLTNIRKAVEIFSKNGVEALIHGGDFCSPFTLAEFKQAVFQMKGTDPSFVVLGASEVNYEKVIGVLDVLQQAEVTKVGLATVTAP